MAKVCVWTKDLTSSMYEFTAPAHTKGVGRWVGRKLSLNRPNGDKKVENVIVNI